MSFETLTPADRAGNAWGGGSFHAWNPVPATPATHYDKVVSSSDSLHLSTTGGPNFKDESFYCTDMAGTGTIASVTVHANLTSFALMNYYFIVVTHSIAYYSSFYSGSGHSDVSNTWAVNPNTGVAWVKSELLYANGFEAGIRVLANGIPPGATFDKCWVIIDFTPTAGGTMKSWGYTIG